MRFAPVLTNSLVTLALIVGSAARGQAPADPLLKLVPADAGVTIALEDLRGQAQTIQKSEPIAGLRKLPAFREWMHSDNVRGVREAIDRVESVLDVKLADITDELLGEAVVLSVHVPEGAGLDAARGILLGKVPNLKLLDKLIDGLNTAMKDSGELVEVSRREYSGTRYSVRTFLPGTRTTEYYATLSGSIFVCSNSEELIRGAIDRQAGTIQSLADSERFRSIRKRLPRRPLLSLFADPRFVERVMTAGSPSSKPEDDAIGLLVGRYVAAMNYLGVSLTWKDGPVVDVEEELDPAKVDPGLARWAKAVRAPVGPALRTIPPTALAVFSGSVDFEAAVALAKHISPNPATAQLDNLERVMKGILLGRKLRDFLPALGPDVLVYLERPESGAAPTRIPGTLVLSLRDEPAAEALRNGLETVLAFYALDEKHDGGRLAVVTRNVAGATITTLGDATPFAFSIHQRRLIFSTSTEGVARALQARANPAAEGHFEALREAYFADAETFACVDLRAVHSFADMHRSGLARRLAARQNVSELEAVGQFDQGLALISLFDAAFFTMRADGDLSRVHHTLGIVAKSAK